LNESRSKREIAAGERPLAGYYDVPAIHGPHWKWLIIGYFYFGGISGSTAVIASIARMLKSPHQTQLVRIATYLSFVSLLPCPIFLILDLGRPTRFLNMLRTVRPSSPMSMGSWGFAAFGLLTVCSTVLQAVVDANARRQGMRQEFAAAALRALAVPTGLAGVFIAGYTGVLLAATAVPIWSKRPAILGPLVFSTAMTSGAASIVAVAAALDVFDSEDVGLAQFEAAAAVVEGGLLLAWLGSLGRTAKPVDSGLLGYVVRNGVAGLGLTLPLAINAAASRLRPPLRRKATFLASALTLAGVLALRYVVVEAGRQSAGDPMATFEMTS
jgi:formate-dependent nitrite reductase membrane component NrfD